MDVRTPAAVIEIASRLRDAGHQAWAVGGAVRDALAGRAGGDWDLATDAHPQKVRRIFRRTVPIGIEHGTVGVMGSDGVLYEVTTFRRDVETDGRHAVIAFADTLEDDLARRDFTINAIAWDPITHELRDPFEGASDLRDRVLRTVGDPSQRFAEDYLRVLRALRFAGHFALEIDHATRVALEEAVSHLDVLSAERVREELVKVLRTRSASVALRLYHDTGVWKQLLPELAATAEIVLDDGLDALTVALRTTDAVSVARPTLRLAALLHTVGYPAAKARDLRGGWRYTGHERMGARHAESILRRLKASNAEIDRVTNLVALQSAFFPPDAPEPAIRRWLAHVTLERVNDLFRLRIATWRARPVEGGDRDILERWRAARAVIRQKPVIVMGGLAIGGDQLRELGLEPGPRFGAILAALLARVIEEPALNDRETLLGIVRREMMSE
jgi:tRNA nucleotidyltransferase/poly(A) polymerase